MENNKGIKHDQDKPQIADFVKDFATPLIEISKVWVFGANKYGKGNWKQVKDGEKRFSDAMVRHLIREDDEIIDPETKILHAAHVAWNALARLYFIIKEVK